MAQGKAAKLASAVPWALGSLPTDLLACIWSFAISSVHDWAVWQSVHPAVQQVLRQPALITQLRLTVHKADITGFGPLASHLRHLEFPLPHFRLAADALAAGNSRLQGLSSLSRLQSLSCQGVAKGSHTNFAGLTRLRHLKLSHSVVAQDLFRHFGQLETLSLDTTNICNDDLQTLAMLNLRGLELHFCTAVTDAGLVHLARLTHLRVLKLRYLANVTNAGVANIAPLKWLETLDLTSARIDDHCDLSPFSDLRCLVLAQTNVTGTTVPLLTKLQKLDLDGAKAGGAFIKRLEGLTALEEVWLNHTLAADADFQDAQLPPSLRALYIDVSKLTGRGFSQPAKLRELRMGYGAATDSSLPSLHSFPNLVKLDLTANVSITSEGLHALLLLRSLATLNLSECHHITCVTPLGSLASLRTLDLSWCKALRDARGLTALESLDLSHTAVDNAGLPTWHQLTNLRRLRLTCSDIDDAGLQGLESVPRLERLDLHRACITDACLPVLSAIPSLVSLDVSGTQITTAEPLAHIKSVFYWHVPTF